MQKSLLVKKRMQESLLGYLTHETDPQRGQTYRHTDGQTLQNLLTQRTQELDVPLG